MSTPKGPITSFPAEGLRAARRFITSHDKNGKGVFVIDDEGDHHRVMVQGKGVANIIYSTADNPVDMNDDKDLVYARGREVKPLSHCERPLEAKLFVKPLLIEVWMALNSLGFMSQTARLLV